MCVWRYWKAPSSTFSVFLYAVKVFVARNSSSDPDENRKAEDLSCLVTSSFVSKNELVVYFISLALIGILRVSTTSICQCRVAVSKFLRTCGKEIPLG